MFAKVIRAIEKLVCFQNYYQSTPTKKVPFVGASYLCT